MAATSTAMTRGFDGEKHIDRQVLRPMTQDASAAYRRAVLHLRSSAAASSKDAVPVASGRAVVEEDPDRPPHCAAEMGKPVRVLLGYVAHWL